MEEIQQEWAEWVKRLMGPEFWMQVGYVILQIIMILIISALIIRIGTSLINRIFRKRERGPFRISERRENTLKKLVQNTLAYVVYFTAFIMILDAMTIPIGALLAGAGVAGLAIGFGTQNLVRDVITGFFIIFEDQFSVGDYIQTAGIEGTVEEIGLRTTKILSWTGELHIVPNGSVDQVTNYSIHNSIAVVDVNIPYEADIPTAERIIEQLLPELPEQYPEMITVPELLGVQTMETSHVVIRVIAEVVPMEHWMIARVLRREIKGRLERHGIDIPLPRMVMYSRDKESSNQNQGERGE
ncbi:mechanosensitive ion channel family protein [Sediminibacillus halophilus]|uniref:Small conductance mechanosensitive channel n=1 Tax=Sediminibacillus halophilus TaxID=482461 RepID=A0A1G9SZY3_9BACI|nr:small conductance mechanosensitive channel [Sediminibacillus halophilus]